MKILKSTILVTALCLAGTAWADGGEEDAQSDPAAPGVQPAATVYFDFDSSEIDAAAKKELDHAAMWLKGTTGGQVVIVGHADEVGTEDYNWKLGGNRASQVKQYLLSQGVDPNRIVIVSRGESMSGGTDAGDRKVVFYATRREAPVAAAPAPEPPPYVPPPTPAPVIEEDDDKIGLAMSLGGGVVGMLDSETRDFTNVGGAWEARLTVGTRVPIAFEGAYVGSAQTVDALGLDPDAMLFGNGLEGALRVNILTSDVQPYIFGGVGWTRYNVVNDDFNTSSIADDEDIFTVPVGLGLGFVMGDILLDLRGTVRPAFDDEVIADTASGESAGMDSWSATARAGWEF